MERSRDWLAQARSDLAHARLDIEHQYFEWACFSAQQAAEKAVKAVLNRLGAEAWGYSVAGLLEHLPGGPDESSELMLNARELDKVYIPSRYPDALPEGSPSTQYERRREWRGMHEKSSSTVKVVFPPFSRDELIERLRDGVRLLAGELPVVRAVLFGSWAAGRATAYSDVDLLIVYRGAVREDAYGVVCRHIEVRGLEPHVYSEGEATAVRDVIERMVRHGVPLTQ